MDVKNTILGILLAFFGALTVGNAPYALTGYGLTTFCLLVIAYCLPRNEAYAAFIIGNTLGLLLDFYTGTLFTFVIIGSIIFRILQAGIIIEGKKRNSMISASLWSIAVLAIIASLIGMYFYGGDGTFTAFTVLDVIYIIPAYLMYLTQKSEELTKEHKFIHYTLIMTAALTVFLSASTFIVPLPMILGILVLLVVAIVTKSARFDKLKKMPFKPMQSYIVSVAVIAVFVATFLLSGPIAGYAVGTVLYPLEPNSLTGTQWTQTHNDNSVCNSYNKNIAGAGEEDNGVWGVERLRVLDTCVTVIGVIDTVENITGLSVDGDFTFNLKVDAGYEYLLSFGSYAIYPGTIHCEVVPSDQASVLSGLNIQPGDHVSVTGVWLLDTNHGWYSEIHPVMNITKI